jgi:N12 class adenine-specific DNA methylase
VAERSVFQQGIADQAVGEYLSANPLPSIGDDRPAAFVGPDRAPGTRLNPSEPFSRPAEERGGAPGRLRISDAPAQLLPLFEEASARHGVPINIIMSLADQESGYNSRAVGTQTQWGHAKGMMQYLDSTARGLNINPYDPAQAIDAAARQIRERLDRGYSMVDAVREHFAGPDRRQWGPKTVRYGEEVLERAGVLAQRIGDRYAPRPNLPPAASEPPAQTEAPAGEGGMLGDAGRLLKIGANSAAANVRELATRILPRGAVDFIDSIDRWATGKSSDELLRADTRAMEEAMTPAMREAMRRDWWDSERGTFGSAWTDPRAYAAGVLQSLPEMAVTMAPAMRMARVVYGARVAAGAAPEVAARAAARAAALTGAITEGGMGGAAAAREVRDAVNALPIETLRQSDAFKALVASGQDEATARRALAEDSSTRAFITAGVATGIFGGMGDRAIAKLITEGVAGGMTRRALRGAATSAAAEGLFEELPQSALSQVAQNEAIRRANPNQSLTEGVANEALGGLAVGSVQGAGMGAVGGAARRRQEAPAGSPSQPAPSPDSPASPPASPIPEEDAAPGRQPEAVASPAAPAGPLQRAIATAAPAVQSEQGQRVSLRAEGMDDIAAVVDHHTPEGVMLRTEDGESLLVTNEDVASGAVEIVREATPATGTQPAPAAQPEAPQQDAIRPAQQEGTAALQAAIEQAPPLPKSGEAPAPAPAPKASGAQHVYDFKGAFLGAEPSAHLRDGLWAAVQAGSDTHAGIRENLLIAAKTAREGGGLETRKQFDAFLKDWHASIVAPRVRIGTAEGNATAMEVIRRHAVAPKEHAARDREQARMAEEDARQGGGLDLATATESELRERLRYLARQARQQGWTKPLLAARAEVEKAINRLATQPAQEKQGAGDRGLGAGSGAVGAGSPSGTAEGPAAAAGDAPAARGDASGDAARGKATAGAAPRGEGDVSASARRPKPKPSLIEAAPADMGERWSGMNHDERADLLRAAGLPSSRRFSSWAGLNDATQKKLAGADPAGTVATQPEPTRGKSGYETADLPRLYAANIDTLRRLPEDAGIAAVDQADQALRNARMFSDLLAEEGGQPDTDGERARTMGELEDRLNRTYNAAQDRREAQPGEEKVPRRKTRKAAAASDAEPNGGAKLQAAAREAWERSNLATDLGDTTPIRNAFAGGFSDGAGVQTHIAEGKGKAAIAFKAGQEGGRRWAGKPNLSPTAAKRAKARPAEAPPAQTENRIFTADAAEKARALLKARLTPNHLNSGVDPEILQAGITLAGYHIERGARTFAAYARAMVGDLGDVVKPYLKSWYMGVKYDPRAAAFEGMDGAAAVDAADVDAALKENEGGEGDRLAGGAGVPAAEGRPADAAQHGAAPADPSPVEAGQPESDGEAGSGGDRVEAGVRPAGEDVGPEGRAGGGRDAGDGRPGGGRAGQPGAGRDGGDAGGVASGKPRADRNGDLARAAGFVERPMPADMPEKRVWHRGETDKIAQDGPNTFIPIGVERPDNGSGSFRTMAATLAAFARRDAAPSPAAVIDAVPETPPAAPSPGNYHVADTMAGRSGGPVARFNRNTDAIELLAALREAGRQATREEQAVLSGYTGWGSFGQELFQGFWTKPMPKEGWEERDRWLRDHLGQAEWESAQRSITNAHYTDPQTVKAMWDVARRLGFQGGRVLEPSMGIGNFFMMMPQDMAARSQLSGIEMEQVTGSMAQHLFPDANVKIMPYQDSRTPDGFYDLVIGNWPFENTVVADRRYNKLSPFLHDFFFLKALDQTRPGGLVIGVTSSGTMDKKGVGVRAAMAKKAELVAAIRLPSGAFQDYAGTKVVTDIVVLKKRPEELTTLPRDAEWVNTEEHRVASGGSFALNSYFIRNPGQILGTLDFGSGTTRGRPGMIVNPPADLAADLAAAVGRLPEGIFERDREPAKRISYVSNHTADRQGSLTIQDGKLYVVRGEQLAPAEEITKYSVKDAAETASRDAQLRALIGMRRAYAALIDAERAGGGDKERAALRASYDAFREAHGSLGESFGLRYLANIRDPFYPALAALETKGKAAEILSRSTMRGKPAMENPGIQDAFILARNEAVSPTLADVARLAKRTPEEVKAELIAANAVFETPSGDIIPSDIYLSGNVRQKLREAEAAAAEGLDGLARNVEALRAVQPPDIPYFQIETQLGATWVPPAVYAEYVAHMLNLPSAAGIGVTFTNGRWTVRLPEGATSRPEALTGYGTSEYRFDRLVNAAFSNQTVTVKRKDADGKEFVDAKATEEANARIAKMRDDLGDWLWSDPERRAELEREYNEVRNAYATPRFDGSFMRMEGMALSVGRGPFDLRAHQKDAIWRALVNRKSINAHEVGTGKTFTMGGIAVESRRYGIAKKPLILAHNANSASVAAEIQQMYPAAKVLYLDNLAPSVLEVRLRQIANDDWDAIVVPHSVIDRFSMREETLMEMAREDIAALEEEAYAAAKDDGERLTEDMMDDEEALKKLRSPTAKELVKARNAIISTIQQQAQRASREGAVPFEDLGVDMLLVDEVHEFKKPSISTRMRMKGLNTQTSNRSIALQFLARYVRSQNNGANIHTFTGTPVTNTLTEVFHQMRYVMEDEMKAAGVDTWDGWFGSFAKEVQDVELSAAGEYEPVTRLAGFINVPELRRMIGQYMDVVFAEDMPEMKPRRTASGKTMASRDLTEAERAELLNGRTEGAMDRPYRKVVNVTSDLTPEQRGIFARLQGYAKAWRAMGPMARKTAMLEGAPESPIITEGMANRASFDVRMLDGEDTAGQEGKGGDDPGSKSSNVVDRALAIYASHPLANQVIFAEQGFSTSATRSAGKDAEGKKRTKTVPTFSTIRDIVERLVQGGIPREQIAVVDGKVSKEKRKQIAEDMNTGRIRVVLGSTDTLGVGVNMQRNLRAMHHMDAPYMPGELVQRNGRGERQGNQWNTVIEYRYMTDRLDGRRWQILATKQRFINAFLRSNADTRVIEGDAAADEENDILQSFSEAAGDPRVLIREKLKRNLETLQRRERQHGLGVADARSKVRVLQGRLAAQERDLAEIEAQNTVQEVNALIEAQRADGFRMTLAGEDYTKRTEADGAFQNLMATGGVKLGDSRRLIGSYADFPLDVEWKASQPNPTLILKVGSEEFEGRSVRSLEGQLRGFPAEVRGRQADLGATRSSLERMEEVARSPFQRAKELDLARGRLAALETDIAENPVPPPAWLRAGAPVESVAYRNGQEFVVSGHRWNSDGYFVTKEDGRGTANIPYMEVTDAQGVPLYEERPFEAPVVQQQAQRPAVQASIPDAPSPVATLTGEEIGGATTPERRKAAVQWMNANIRGRPIFSAALGASVVVNRKGMTKTVSGGVGDRILDGVPAIEAIIRDGRLVETLPPRPEKGDTAAVAWHRLEGTVSVAGEPRTYRVLIREEANGSFHYRLEADRGEMETPRTLSSTDQQGKAGEEAGMRGAVLNLEEAPGSFKPSPQGWGEVDAAGSPVMSEKTFALVTAALRQVAGPELVVERGATPRSVEGLAYAHIVRFAMHVGDDRAPWVAVHEGLHALRNMGRITAREWSVLVDAAKREGWAQRFNIERRYQGQNAATQEEEAIAEAFAAWATNRFEAKGPVARIFAMVRTFLTRLRNALAQRGFQTAEDVFGRALSGEMGARPLGSADRDGARSQTAEQQSAFLDRYAADQSARPDMRASREPIQAPEPGKVRDFLRSMLDKAEPRILAAIPLRPLMEEVGHYLPSAKSFLKTKQAMDAMRAEWFNTSAEVSNRWLKFRSADKAGNAALMEIMHAATLAGVDPSKPFVASRNPALDADRRPEWDRLRKRFEALPEEGRALFQVVRDTYSELADAFDAALLNSVDKSVRVRELQAERQHKRELKRIDASPTMTEEQKEAARGAAERTLKGVRTRVRLNRGARMYQLRAQFESNRVQGPYFPLARFGDYYVTARNTSGEVVSFSRFENSADQRRFARQMEKAGHLVEMDRIANDKANGLRGAVDPTFVAEVESILEGANAPSDLMDEIWQRFLQRMPDLSIRTSKIHRKGTAGFTADAIRAFGFHMFHGSHQLARLNYAADLSNNVDDMAEEARDSGRVNTATAVVNEARNRLAFIMNPTGGSLAQGISTAGFLYHLSASPAAAAINLTQTTMGGIPILAAYEGTWSKGFTSAAAQLTRAMKDLMAGYGKIGQAPNLTDDERDMVKTMYEIGLADRTQTHDLAGVGEVGVRYNATRQKVVNALSFAFHHAERVNREITALAAYRMARNKGLAHAEAIDAANSLTWKIHFDYQNTSRPRIMQNDAAKVLLMFRNFTVNMLYRLFRDMSVAVQGETPELRKEARMQLLGTTMMFLSHAGIKGVWGFSLAMMLAGLFMGPAEDAEDELKKWMQANLGAAMTAVLMDGIPGWATGTALSNRIGMGDLWFRSQDRDLEGKEEWWALIGQFLGAGFGILENMRRGTQMAMDGNVVRGIETAAPKAIRDIMKALRYAIEGATTAKGDPLLESVPTQDVVKQLLGFTPARVAEVQERNNAALNMQKAITERRSDIIRDYAAALREDNQAALDRAQNRLEDFNRDFPEKGISGADIIGSNRTFQRNRGRADGGINLDPKLNEAIRGRLPARAY